MLSLIAFGPADEYMKRAGITAEPEEEKPMDENEIIKIRKREQRYLDKYGAADINTALDSSLSEAAKTLSVSMQTISNIRAAFNGRSVPGNGEAGEGKKSELTEPIRNPEGFVQINPEINIHFPSEITVKVRFIK